MVSRRIFLSAVAAGSVLSRAKAARRPASGVTPLMAAVPSQGYSHAELEAKVARRDFRGLTKRDLPTPNLVLDQELFEGNLKTMIDHCKRTGINLRAHVKVHRSAEVAKRQIDTGSIGLCCATISECELMTGAGLPGIFWTCQPVGPNKYSRIVALAKKDPSFMFVVEDPMIVDDVEQLAAAEKVNFNVVVDNDVGIGRQGVMPGTEAPRAEPARDEGQASDPQGSDGVFRQNFPHQGLARTQARFHRRGRQTDGVGPALPQGGHPGGPHYRRQHRVLQH